MSKKVLLSRSNTLKGSMKMKTVVQTSITEYSIFRWLVPDYENLDYGVLYCQVYDDKNVRCVFKLIKTSENLYVGAFVGYKNADALFYIDNGGEDASTVVPATEIMQGLYAAEFPHNLIFPKKGYYMKRRTLKLAFRIILGLKTKTQSRPYGEIGILTDVDYFCSDMRHFYFRACHTDFTINVADTSLKVHKCILLARSEFFEEYFRKWEGASSIRLQDTTPGIIHEVMLYMYSGELWEMNPQWMVKVYELAYLLRIPSLKERCSKFFEEARSRRAVLDGITFWEYIVE